MPLKWTVEQRDKPQTIHHSRCTSTDPDMIKVCVGETIEKAISLLDANIQDNSLYFLIEWDHDQHKLCLVICDDKKQQRSPQEVHCHIEGDKASKEDYAQELAQWARDYLTTSESFIRFSLVAVFRLAGQEQVILL